MALSEGDTSTLNPCGEVHVCTGYWTVAIHCVHWSPPVEV